MFSFLTTFVLRDTADSIFKIVRLETSRPTTTYLSIYFHRFIYLSQNQTVCLNLDFPIPVVYHYILGFIMPHTDLDIQARGHLNKQAVLANTTKITMIL